MNAEKNTSKKLDDHSLRIRAVENAVLHLTKIAVMVQTHDETLKGKDDAPGFLERVRDLETTRDSLLFWMRALALAFIGQFAAVMVSTFIFLLKILPVIVSLAQEGVKNP